MSSETLSTVSPTTNSVVVTRQALSPGDIAQLPSTGQQAFKHYRRSHPTLASRQEVVTEALKLLSERKDVLSRELTEQMGRPIAYTGVEIDTAVKRGQYLNRIAGEVLEVDVPGDSEKGFTRFIRREPVGVVLIIFAWNVRSFFSASTTTIGLTYRLVSLLDPHQLSSSRPPGRQHRHSQTFSSNSYHCRAHVRNLHRSRSP